MFDLVIKNGRVIDGTGNPWIRADIGIKDKKINNIGKIVNAQADRIIDLNGLFVAPGFIDMHSHSDHVLLFDGRAESKIMQGVTTEVTGNCGSSAAPLSEISTKILNSSIKTFLDETNLSLTWKTMDQYLNLLELNGTSVNVAPLVGHGTLRMSIMGMEGRIPEESELEGMKNLTREVMKSGAFGMSTGLIYPPGVFAKTDEIVELAKVVAEFNGIYSSHTRGAGETMIEAVKEALVIGQKANISVQISHLKAAGIQNWGKVKDALKIMGEKREYIESTCDVYPYTASSFSLSALLPPWVREGGSDKLVNRLMTNELRDKIKQQMMNGMPGWSSPLKQSPWDAIIISRSSTMEEIEGLSIKQVSENLGKDPFEFLFDFLVNEKGGGWVIRFTMSEEDVSTVISHKLSMIGSDGRAVSPYGVLSKGKPHPRYYGTFPRVISLYVKKKKILSLEDSIRKMTSLPARKLGLSDRGLIRSGLYADLVVFDLEIIKDRAKIGDPHKFPEGIEYVIVNGGITVDKGKHKGILNGQILRKTRS